MDELDSLLEMTRQRMRMKHVVVVLNKGFGDNPEEITLRPRDGEHLDQWDVREEANSSMVCVWAVFADANGMIARQQIEYFNSFRLDRVYAAGDK